MIETFLEDITNNLINGIIGSSIFVNTTRGMIGLFIVISSILFLTGTLQITQRELIVRLFKAILIGVMLSPTSLGLLSSILPLAKDTANYVGNLLVNSIVSYNQNNSYTTPTELVGEGAHSFAILDIIVTLLLSSVLHAKILGLLFTNYVIFIPLIYIALFMMLKGIFQLIKIYFFALIALTFLCMMTPLFLVMLMFNVTSSMYNVWLKSIIRFIFQLFLSLTVLSLCFTFLFNQLRDLMHYKVCYNTIFPVFRDGSLFHLFDFRYWQASGMDTALTLGNYLQFFLAAVILNLMMSQVEDTANKLTS